MSITTCVLPAAIFLESIEAISCESGSRRRIRSIRISLSSAGARPREPPHARQAPFSFTILCNSEEEKSTRESVSITSAVPAAEVIAREEVLGITIPDAAHIETTIGVVLFPATPPIQCLSATNFEDQRRTLPVLYMASVK